MDVYGRGDNARFRFFDNNPHTGVFTEISKHGLSVIGDLNVTGRYNRHFQGFASSMTCANQLQFQGSAATAITIDGMLIVAEMPAHNSHQVCVRAYDIKNGRYLTTIEPSINRGSGSPKYAGGQQAYGGYYYGSITQAETHTQNGSEKDRSKTTVLYWVSHNMPIRIEYNKSTKLFTSKKMGTSRPNSTHYWQPIANYSSGKTYDNMLVMKGDPDSSVNPDNNIRIYNQVYNGSGWSESWRYLGLSNISGYKEVVNNDSNSYTFMYIAGLNPYSGRVYIHGSDDGSMLHTFQIKSSLKRSENWAETMWDNMSNTGSPNYGNQGGLEYIKSHKIPYVNEYVNDDASSFSKRITFDPATKLPVCITIAAYGNDHGSGGTKVLPWNPDWT